MGPACTITGCFRLAMILFGVFFGALDTLNGITTTVDKREQGCCLGYAELRLAKIKRCLYGAHKQVRLFASDVSLSIGLLALASACLPLFRWSLWSMNSQWPRLCRVCTPVMTTLFTSAHCLFLQRLSRWLSRLVIALRGLNHGKRWMGVV